MADMNKVAELLKDEELVKKLESTADLTELAEILQEKGITYTELFTVAKEAGIEVNMEAEDELDENALTEVAGGSVLGIAEALKYLSKTELGKLGWEGTKIVCRCFYDYAKYGDPYKTYSEKKVQEITKKLDKYYKKLPKWLR